MPLNAISFNHQFRYAEQYFLNMHFCQFFVCVYLLSTSSIDGNWSFTFSKHSAPTRLSCGRGMPTTGGRSLRGGQGLSDEYNVAAVIGELKMQEESVSRRYSANEKCNETFKHSAWLPPVLAAPQGALFLREHRPRYLDLNCFDTPNPRCQ